MKTTTLYLHESTACWMQWRGKRLLDVYCEPVSRELVERAASSPKKDGIQTLCPWLNAHSPQVRLLIDPVADQTQLIPAFDHGFSEPHGALERLRQLAEQVYITCRSLTSDVLADDLTRYRHDRLKKYPNALLQWHGVKASQSSVKPSSTPQHWLVSDSGLTDYVFGWLSSMADNGLEFVDVQAVCALYARQDAHIKCPVITVWVQSNRCRLIQCDSGFVVKVEQWNNTVEARIGLQETVAVLTEDGQEVMLNYVGCENELKVWQEALPGIEINIRTDGIVDVGNCPEKITDKLPEACLNLPLNALIRKSAGIKFRLWSSKPHWEAGASIRILLSIARWKRRYKQTVIATTLAATFSGYFVLLACMHAIHIIELHQRSGSEILSLKSRRSLLEKEIQSMSGDSENAIWSIEKLNAHDLANDKDDQVSLELVAKIIKSQPNISINSLSWRRLEFSQPDSTLMNELAEIGELRNEVVSAYDIETNVDSSERLLLISGNVAVTDGDEFSRQQFSDVLIAFLQALSEHERIVEVMPLNDFMSGTTSVNLPSDVVVNGNDESGFVLAVRVIV